MIRRALQLGKATNSPSLYRLARAFGRIGEQLATTDTLEDRVVQEPPTNIAQEARDILRQPYDMIELVIKPNLQNSTAEEAIRRMQSMWKVQQHVSTPSIKRRKLIHEDVVLTCRHLLNSKLNEEQLMEFMFHVKQLLISEESIPQEHFPSLRGELREMMKTSPNSQTIASIAERILKDECTLMQLVRYVILLEYLPAQATNHLLRKINPIVPHLSEQSILQLASELVDIPYELEHVPLVQILKASAQLYSIYHSVHHIYLLVRIAQRHGMQSSPLMLHFYTRTFQETSKTPTYTADELLKLILIHGICTSLNIYTKRSLQIRSSRNRISSLQGYISRDARLSLNFILKAQVELNKHIHVGDALLSKLPERINTKDLSPRGVSNLVECLDQITKDMNVLNYTIINDGDFHPRINEFVPAISNRTIKIISEMMKEFIPNTCPKLLFRFNTSNDQWLDDRETGNGGLEIYIYRGIIKQLPLIRILLKGKHVASATTKCFNALVWEELDLTDMNNIAKHLANNLKYVTVTPKWIKPLWKRYNELIRDTQPEQKELQFLYFYSLIHKETRLEALEHFKERLVPKLKLGRTNLTSLEDPVLSIMVSVRQLHYLIPFLQLNFLQLSKSFVQELLQQYELELARVCNRWDSALLRLNLISLEALNEELPTYRPEERLMEALIRNMSVFLVHVFNKRYFMVKHSEVNEQFVRVIKWILNYSWSERSHTFKPFTSVGLQAVVNHLYSHLSLETIQQMVRFMGADRRFYLPETLKIIRTHHIQGATNEEVEELRAALHIQATGSPHVTEIMAPPREDASVYDYEQYLKKAFHEKGSKFLLRKEPQSRQELLLGVCLGVASQIENQTNFDLSHDPQAEIIVDLNKYKSEIEKIFNISVANLDENQTIKVEAVDEHFCSTKVEFIDHTTLTTYEEGLTKYTHVTLPIYSAAQETIRGLMFGIPNFMDVAKRMNPPNIMTNIVVELVRNSIQYSVHGPIIKLNMIAATKGDTPNATPQNKLIVTASPQSWRIRLIWSYILEQEGYEVYMINTNDPIEQIVTQLQAILKKKR